MAADDDAKFVLNRTERLFDSDRKVKFGACVRVIRASAWWYGHKSGPVKAPQHADRVAHGLLEFGANYFWVDLAIECCVKILECEANIVLANRSKVDGKRVAEAMCISVRGCVSNRNFSLYKEPYDAPNNFMHFGTQAINVRDFVGELLNLCEAQRLFR